MYTAVTYQPIETMRKMLPHLNQIKVGGVKPSAFSQNSVHSSGGLTLHILLRLDIFLLVHEHSHCAHTLITPSIVLTIYLLHLGHCEDLYGVQNYFITS